MSQPRRLLAILVTVLTACTSMPLAATAQTAPAPPPPSAPPPSPAVPPPSANEPPPMQTMQPEAVLEKLPPPGTGAKIGAGVLNVVYLPGKAIICGAGVLAAGAFMIATFGSAHREATSFFNEGCGGAWLLTPEQVAAAPKQSSIEY